MRYQVMQSSLFPDRFSVLDTKTDSVVRLHYNKPNANGKPASGLSETEAAELVEKLNEVPVGNKVCKKCRHRRPKAGMVNGVCEECQA